MLWVLEKLALPFLVAAALLAGAVAAPLTAYAEEGDNESPVLAYAGVLDDMSGKLDGIGGTLEGVSGKLDAMQSSESDGVGGQVLADFFFIECATCVLLALNLGALCWICFRAR